MISSSGPRALRLARRSAGLLLASLLPLAAVSGCSSDAPEMTPVTSLATAPASGAALDVATFRAALARPGTTVIDVRTPAEFADGHLPGAVNIDVQGADFASRLAALDPSKPYAVYCHSGNRSGAAVAMMQAAGFTSTYHLDGGIAAWQAAGGQVATP